MMVGQAGWVHVGYGNFERLCTLPQCKIIPTVLQSRACFWQHT